MPCREYRRVEGGVAKPSVFKPEDARFRDSGGNSEEARGVVGGGADESGQGGIGERATLFRVNKNSVETCERGVLALVTQGVQSIE